MFQPNVNVNPSRKKMSQLFPQYGYTQEQATPPLPPPSTSPLGALAKSPKKDVTKVTIAGGGGGAGDTSKQTPKHGAKHPYSPLMVWDSAKKKYVKKNELTANPDKVVIDTAPKKK